MRNILGDSLWWGFYEFQVQRSGSLQSQSSSSSLSLQRWIPVLLVPQKSASYFLTASLISFQLIFHFITRQRKKATHKAEAKMHSLSFTNYISLDLIIWENRIKLLSVCIHRCLCVCMEWGSDDMLVIWVLLRTCVPECVPTHVPSVALCYQPVWPWVPMSF